MTPDDFEFICKLLQQASAVVLERGKEYLVESRLGPVVRRLGLASITDLVARLRAPGSNGLVPQVIDALVTTETSFFRDVHPFESLRKVVVPDLIRRRAGDRALAIWCCASSTGQEPYSLAMLLHDHFPELRTWKVFLLATDVSREMLARAREGRYNQLEVNRGLPAALLVKYFEQHGTHWQLRDEVRRLVDFRELNLSQPWPPLPRMDLVINRNVMIYFDVATRKSILSRTARLLRPDGYLLLGGSETTYNLDDSFQRVQALTAGFYQLAAAPK
jgi:chemotaxis protein methyltransferase CheR